MWGEPGDGAVFWVRRAPTCAPAAGRLQRASAGYGEADRDSISWCCEKSKRPGAPPRALSGRLGAILPPAALRELREPLPRLVLGVWESRGAIEKCQRDHRARVVGLDPAKPSSASACTGDRVSRRCCGDVRASYSLPGAAMALGCSRQTPLGPDRSSGEDVLGGFSGGFGHVK